MKGCKWAMSRIALHERRHSADFGWRNEASTALETTNMWALSCQSFLHKTRTANPAQDLQIEEPGMLSAWVPQFLWLNLNQEPKPASSRLAGWINFRKVLFRVIFCDLCCEKTQWSTWGLSTKLGHPWNGYRLDTKHHELCISLGFFFPLPIWGPTSFWINAT